MYSIELQTVFYEYQNKNHKINTSFVSPGLRPLAADKTGFNLNRFDIRGKLSIIRCDKYILLFPYPKFLVTKLVLEAKNINTYKIKITHQRIKLISLKKTRSNLQDRLTEKMITTFL